MATTRPAVLISQDFPEPVNPPANAPLGALIVGPVYALLDFPEDKTAGKLAATYGSAARTAASALPLTGSPALTAPVPSLPAGAALDATSVKVYLASPRVELVAGADGTMAIGTATLGSEAKDFVAAGVQPGDMALVTSGGVTLSRRVRTVATHQLTFTDETPASGFTAGGAIAFRVERVLPDTQVPVGKVTVDVEAGTVSVDGGVSFSGLPVSYATAHVACRALRTDVQSMVGVDKTNVAAVLGPKDARNPLRAGADVALANTGTGIWVYGVGSDDDAGYLAVLDALSSRKDFYCVALCTGSLSVVAAYKAAFQTVADPDLVVSNNLMQKFHSVLAGGIALPAAREVAAGTDGELLVSGGGGGMYDLVSASAFFQDGATAAEGDFVAEDATFVDAVRVGDRVVLPAVTAKVEAVLSNQRLRVSALTGVLAAGSSLTYRVERALDKEGQVALLLETPASISSRRAVICWPDEVKVSGLVDGSLARLPNGTKAPAGWVPSYPLACAVAGLTAGNPSQQGFTNATVAGIEALRHSTGFFSVSQLTRLSNAGWFVFEQASPAALPKVMHQVTTDVSSPSNTEYSMVKNADFVAINLAAVFDEYLGKWNAIESTLGFLKLSLSTKMGNLIGDVRPRIGAPLVSGTIVNAVLPENPQDTAELEVDLDYPAPLNTVKLRLVGR